MIDPKRIVLNVVVGIPTALVIDLDAWAKSGGKYDWRLALARAAKGAVIGLGGGAGLEGIAG